MVRENEIKWRFIKQLDDIGEQARNIVSMINGGYLDTVPCKDEMDSGICWLKDLKEVNKMMDQIDEEIFLHQAKSDDYPLGDIEEEDVPF